MAASVKPKETSRIVLLAKLYTPFGGVSIPGVRVYICHKLSKEKTKKNSKIVSCTFYLWHGSHFVVTPPIGESCADLYTRTQDEKEKKVGTTGEDEKATDFSHGSLDDSIDFFEFQILRVSHGL